MAAAGPRPVFAADTSVSAEKSQAEIQTQVRRYGGRSFMYGWQDDEPDARAVVAFVLEERQVRFLLPLPSRDDQRFTHTPTGKQRRAPEDAERAWEQGCRARWRSLALVIRAKLEAVASGIVTFEDEFLAHIVLPEGDTVSERLQPALAETFRAGRSAPGLVQGGALALGSGR